MANPKLVNFLVKNFPRGKLFLANEAVIEKENLEQYDSAILEHLFLVKNLENQNYLALSKILKKKETDKEINPFFFFARAYALSRYEAYKEALEDIDNAQAILAQCPPWCDAKSIDFELNVLKGAVLNNSGRCRAALHLFESLNKEEAVAQNVFLTNQDKSAFYVKLGQFYIENFQNEPDPTRLAAAEAAFLTALFFNNQSAHAHIGLAAASLHNKAKAATADPHDSIMVAFDRAVRHARMQMDSMINNKDLYIAELIALVGQRALGASAISAQELRYKSSRLFNYTLLDQGSLITANKTMDALTHALAQPVTGASLYVKSLFETALSWRSQTLKEQRGNFKHFEADYNSALPILRHKL